MTAYSNVGPSPNHLPISISVYKERELLLLLRGINVAIALVTLSVYLHEGMTLLTWASLGQFLVTLFAYGLYKAGKLHLVSKVLVYSLIVSGACAVAAHGTVRSMASMVMLASVIGAGTFLSRRHTVIATLLCALLLGLLNLAENAGLLHSVSQGTGLATWVTQTAVLACLAASVSMGRQRMLRAIRSQKAALDLARQTEVLLRQSQSRFQALFRSTPAACLVQSLDTYNVLEVNQAFQTLFGVEQNELVGRKPPRLWTDEKDLEAFQHQIIHQGRVQGMKLRALRKDGSSFHAMVYGEQTENTGERLLIAVVFDVSSEVASRHELEISRDRFSKAFNFSPLGMTITRLSDGQVIEVNPSHERVLGWNQADFAGHAMAQAQIWATEADRIRYVYELQKQGRLQGYETPMRTKAGTVVPVKIWSETIEIDFEPCALSFTLNVDEERRREAMLLNVAEGVSGETGEAFFRSLVVHLAETIGADGVMVGELDAPLHMTTLAVVRDGQLLPNGAHDLHRTLCEQALAQAELLRHESANPIHLPLVPPFEQKDLTAFLGLPLRDDAGLAVGLITAVWRQRPPKDTHQQALLTIFASRCKAELLRLQSDRQIRKMQATLEQRVTARTEQLQYLNSELDAFAHTVSHDLKAPLRAIDGFSKLLREQMTERATQEDSELLNRIDGSVRRMSSLITDLLSMAQVSQGALNRSHTDLSQLAREVMEQERLRDPSRTVAVTIEGGLTAHCDRSMAHIVLENLLGNAWKYSRKQGNAQISLVRVDNPHSSAPAFCVRDNGAGFDMSRSERLFKAFNRLHNSHEFEGSGVGLATVRRILERHGGFIHGQGAVGQGASFVFSFGHDVVD